MVILKEEDFDAVMEIVNDKDFDTRYARLGLPPKVPVANGFKQTYYTNRLNGMKGLMHIHSNNNSLLFQTMDNTDVGTKKSLDGNGINLPFHTDRLNDKKGKGVMQMQHSNNNSMLFQTMDNTDIGMKKSLDGNGFNQPFHTNRHNDKKGKGVMQMQHSNNNSMLSQTTNVGMKKPLDGDELNQLIHTNRLIDMKGVMQMQHSNNSSMLFQTMDNTDVSLKKPWDGDGSSSYSKSTPLVLNPKYPWDKKLIARGDSKKIRRTLSNRKSAKKAARKRLDYAEKMLKKVKELEEFVRSEGRQVAVETERRQFLQNEKIELMEKVHAVKIDEIKKEAISESLRKEIDLLQHPVLEREQQLLQQQQEQQLIEQNQFQLLTEQYQQQLQQQELEGKLEGVEGWNMLLPISVEEPLTEQFQQQLQQQELGGKLEGVEDYWDMLLPISPEEPLTEQFQQQLQQQELGGKLEGVKEWDMHLPLSLEDIPF